MMLDWPQIDFVCPGVTDHIKARQLILIAILIPLVPLILPEMASVFHSLGQILCGEEGEPRPKRVFS